MARECGALQRSRRVNNADELLRLLLLHIGPGLSLRQTVVRARQSGLPQLSDVALLKRLRAAGNWLQALCAAMLQERAGGAMWRWLPGGCRVVAVDSTTVNEPGATGTDWRVHYSIELPSLLCDQMQISDAQGGESLLRVPLRRADLVLADRGYCRKPQLNQVLNQEAHFVVRWHSQCVPVEVAAEGGGSLMEWLAGLGQRQAGELAVRVSGIAKPLRLCAVRVSAAAAQRELERIRESARKNGRRASAACCALSDYVIVITSLPKAELDAAQAMRMFRLRWQIELCFKRLKSLLQTGHVPKYDPASARAWLQGKMLVSLLADRLLEESELFSPWGYPLPEIEPLV